MSRWFRWYEGSVEDAKFRLVARLSRVTVRDVIALWAFILEDAANLDHRGVCKRNEDFMAATLDFDDGVVERILESMEDAGLISVGTGAVTVCNFNKRQFESDTDKTAARRQREKRERDKVASNDPVTRDTGGSDTDTDTDTDTEKKISSPKRVRTHYPEDFEEFWKGYPTDSNMSKSEAFSAWRRLPEDDRKLAIASLTGFREFCRKDQTYRPIHAVRYLQKRRFEGHAGTATTLKAVEETGFYAAFNSAELAAWTEFERRTKGRAGPRDRAGGWRYPQRWPPDHAEVAA